MTQTVHAHIEVPLTQGFVALIDEADAKAVLAYKWCVQQSATTDLCYAARNVRRADGRQTLLLLHTFLTGWRYVDHRDGNGLNNRTSNLREATSVENMRNTRRRRDNTSGFKGVSWHKADKTWYARIRFDNKRIHLGYFRTADEAARAYDTAARDLFGEFAALNFPLLGERAA